MIFIDADVFIALHHEDDVHYGHSLGLFRKLHKQGTEFITSWDVIDEVATKLSQFTYKKNALEFLSSLNESRISIVFANHKLCREAIKFFKIQSSKRVSMTDCMNMAIMKEKRITTILSFDKHYEKNGFILYT